MISSGQLFRTWFGIGILSFGGGATTLTLIRRSAVAQHGWISDQEFTRCWALCQMTPGVNLIAITILLGFKIAGVRGSATCLAGLLLPSAVVTVLLTALFLSVKDLPAVQATLKGVMPATIGLGLVTSFQMAQAPIEEGRKMGAWGLFFTIFLLIGSGLLMLSGVASVTIVLVAASLIGAFEGSVRSAISKRRNTQ